MKQLDMNERHFSILQQLDANERRLCKNYPEGREGCRACFETDNIRELKELVAVGMVQRKRNLLTNQREKYHIPGSMKMSRYSYGLTDLGRMAYEGIMQQVKAQTDD